MFFLKPNIEKMERDGDIKGLLDAINYQNDEITHVKAFTAIDKLGNSAIREFIYNSTEKGKRNLLFLENPIRIKLLKNSINLITFEMMQIEYREISSENFKKIQKIIKFSGLTHDKGMIAPLIRLLNMMQVEWSKTNSVYQEIILTDTIRSLMEFDDPEAFNIISKIKSHPIIVNDPLHFFRQEIERYIAKYNQKLYQNNINMEGKSADELLANISSNDSNIRMNALNQLIKIKWVPRNETDLISYLNALSKRDFLPSGYVRNVSIPAEIENHYKSISNEGIEKYINYLILNNNGGINLKPLMKIIDIITERGSTKLLLLIFQSNLRNNIDGNQFDEKILNAISQSGNGSEDVINSLLNALDRGFGTKLYITIGSLGDSRIYDKIFNWFYNNLGFSFSTEVELKRNDVKKSMKTILGNDSDAIIDACVFETGFDNKTRESFVNTNRILSAINNLSNSPQSNQILLKLSKWPDKEEYISHPSGAETRYIIDFSTVRERSMEILAKRGIYHEAINDGDLSSPSHPTTSDIDNSGYIRELSRAEITQRELELMKKNKEF